ncbi:MAG: aminotransferase class V-fold PLP-dependent enzyme, partial [Candidatus Bathyarchaeia archaeon]
SQSFVIMMELIEKSGEFLAKVTGAEAGLVTSGASAALVLGTAACLMRGTALERFDPKPYERLALDREWMELIQSLPSPSQPRNEVIIQKAHRNPYDHAFKVAGCRLVVVGGDKGCTPEEIEAAINERTAAVAFTARMEDVGLSLRTVADLAHRHGVPVIVDAAAELPPRSNLRRYLEEGADLVAFSGGKHIGGPNGTGILVGKKNLIRLATLQAAPYRGIGRAMKVDRSQIVGLITALKLWLERDEEEEFQGWLRKADWIKEQLSGARGVSSSIVESDARRRYVQTLITLEENLKASDLVINLRKGDPSIWVNYIEPNKIGIDPSLLRDGEEGILVSALKREIERHL